MNANFQKIGRVIYGIPFIMFGMFHFMKANDMAMMMLDGWPIAVVLVYIVGLALVLAGISFIINKKAKMAGMLLAVLLLIFILTLHIPTIMNAADEASRMGPMTNMLKDIGLMGAALVISSVSQD
jgi:putative oxidoreductase